MTTFLHTNLGGLLGPDHYKISYVKMKVEGIAKQIEKVVQLAPHHPQQVFTVLRLSTLAQATYLQRTVDVPPDIYQPIDTAMANTSIPYLLKWEHITEAQIQMVRDCRNDHLWFHILSLKILKKLMKNLLTSIKAISSDL